MVVIRAGATEQDHVGLLGVRGVADDVQAGHVSRDVTVVDQKASSTRIVRADVIGGQHGGGDHLIGPDVHPGIRQRRGDLHSGQRRGVGEVGACDPTISEDAQCLDGAGDGTPRRHQHTVDVEHHRADGHVNRP
jgi:hypothetical protein